MISYIVVLIPIISLFIVWLILKIREAKELYDDNKRHNYKYNETIKSSMEYAVHLLKLGSSEKLEESKIINGKRVYLLQNGYIIVLTETNIKRYRLHDDLSIVETPIIKCMDYSS